MSFIKSLHSFFCVSIHFIQPSPSPC
jgi:hypothetical protein